MLAPRAPSLLFADDPAGQTNGAIAQLGERYNGIVEVSGSIPLGSTKITPWETRGFFFFELDRRCDIVLVMAVWVKLGVK